MAIEYTDGTKSSIYFKTKNTNSLTLFVTPGNKTISKFVFMYGSTGTDLEPKKCGIFEGVIKESAFEPYIPSVKMLADEVSAQNNNLSVIGKCKNLLNPTLATTTQNGVTCTNNGDGTYNIVGTNNTSSNATFICDVVINGTGQGKLLGVPKGSSGITLQTNYDGSWGQSLYWDSGNGAILPNIEKVQRLAILVKPDTTVNHTIKPMITTDLNATYDDFVPYTADGDTLAADVAELKNDLVCLILSASGTILLITDGTNTWTLKANS